ncbi:MAG TPA: glutamine--fructose-6-phosphate transaminase (isomerizing), partial [Clostridiales bacterium]|nr:glutamine--fructose-6-phosphate transaminase (isomerizing) [Clostridiales bacterium]
MCGIVGYIGAKDCVELLLSGLESLEYRGYDSAGIAVYNGEDIEIKKEKGRLSKLREILENSPVCGNSGIGHTRWATHGVPSVKNSHPHTNGDGTIAVVHNGIIENHEALKRFLIDKGYTFISETDTEVIPNLIDYYYEGDLLTAVRKAAKKLDGSYAIGVLCKNEPDKIIAVRKDSPLIVGLTDDGNFIASDIPAILAETRDVYLLNDGEFVTLKKDSVSICDIDENPINKEVYRVQFSAQASQKEGYDHFMLKEIHEQPQAIRNTLRGRLDKNLNLFLDNIEFSEDIKKLYIVACGTAYHAGLVGKKAIESLAKIPCEVCLASEFRYGEPLMDKNTAVFVVSQSGETADTLAVLRMAKKLGNKVYAITNVVGSSVAREADYVFYTYAGPEIAVASTKAYTTQLVAFYLFAIYFAEKRGIISQNILDDIKNQLLKVDDTCEKILETAPKIKEIAKKIAGEHDIYFLGRGLDYVVAMEASLKLKEISYIHSDAYASGELKHGPIALIDNGTVVISICTNPDISNKLSSNVKEVLARGAKTIGFTSCLSDTAAYGDIVELPQIDPLLAPLPAIIPLQLLAYYVCIEKGFDVDKPRNLAKS